MRRGGAPVPPRRRLRPVHPLLLAGLAAWSCLALALGCREIAVNPDLPWHLEFGRRILAGRGWPSTDTLTYTAAGRPYIDLHWAWQAVAAWVASIGGLGLVILLHAALTAGALTLPFVASGWRRSVRGPTLWAALVILLGMEIRFAVRPEVASLLFLSVSLAILWFISPARPRALWLLVPLQVLWTNTQPLFPLGILTALSTAVGELGEATLRGGRARRAAWRRRRTRTLSLVVPALFVATLANPYGVRGALFPLELLNRVSGSSSVYREAISELLPTFHEAGDSLRTVIPIALGLAAACAGWGLRARRRGWARGILVLLPFFYLGLNAVRNVPYVLLVGLFLWAEASRRGFGALGSIRSGLRFRAAGSAAFLVACLVLVGAVATNAYYGVLGRGTRTGLRLAPLSHPGKTVLDRAALLPPGVRIFNGLDTAGHLAAIPAREGTLFIDGRLEVMREDVFGAYAAAMSGRTGFEQARARYGFRAAFLSTRLSGGLRMAADLIESGDWTCVAVSPSTILLVERTLMTQLGWAGARSEDYAASLANENDPRSLRQAGRAAIALGWIDPAVDLLQRSIAGDPGDPGARVSLVEALAREGAYRDARLVAEEAVRRFPHNYGLHEALAQIQALEGDEAAFDARVDFMKRRFASEPRLWLFLARYYEQTGDRGSAAEARRRAEALRPRERSADATGR